MILDLEYKSLCNMVWKSEKIVKRNVYGIERILNTCGVKEGDVVHL